MLRIKQLEAYSEELIAPKSIWISGLFNPMSYITAIMQVTARRDSLALDDMVLKTDVINIRDYHDVQEAAENGAYLHGFYLQGASWELGRGPEQGNLAEMIPKELYPELPVMHITAIERKNLVKQGFYECPVYTTSSRGGTFVFTSRLKMESEEFDDKIWILNGVALLL
jgi:dynein heavy chain